MRNIIIAYSKAEDAEKIRSLLARNGHRTAAVTTSGARALTQAETLEEGVLICGYRLRDMLCTDLAEDLPEGFRMLVITSQVHVEEIENAYEQTGRVRILTAPLKVHELLRVLEEMPLPSVRKRRGGKSVPEKSPEELQVIERAKALLMERNRMTEPEAHRYLQKCAMDSGTKISETAEMILLLSESGKGGQGSSP